MATPIEPGFRSPNCGVECVTGRREWVPTVDPLGRRIRGEILIAGDTAYVESAHACGLHLLAQDERDPKITTSYGLGALVFAAADATELEHVLASMPLRVWRSDVVVPLGPHPNDPPATRARGAQEFAPA